MGEGKEIKRRRNKLLKHNTTSMLLLLLLFRERELVSVSTDCSWIIGCWAGRAEKVDYVSNRDVDLKAIIAPN